jgi:FlaA1/EpsC-like NDP-sugar epimerase
MLFDGKSILVTGGTGSLGKVLVRRLLNGGLGQPKKIIVFSRDEAKQHNMRLEYQHKIKATDEVIYNNFKQLLEFRIGDIRNYASVCSALKQAQIVINAAALKQVPSCEYFPFEAVQTNIIGAENIVRAISENNLPVETVIGVSTDKACKPVNVMGMTKALQERVLISANILAPGTRFVCVRYGNVLASRGSVIPLFHHQIKNGGPVTVTTREMTRFLMPLEHAVDTIMAAILTGTAGETYIPQVPAARILDLAQCLVGDRDVPIRISGIRPGEKIHEVLISQEEAWHTVKKDRFYAIKPLLPELREEKINQAIDKEYSSKDSLMTIKDIKKMLTTYRLGVEHASDENGEMLR